MHAFTADPWPHYASLSDEHLLAQCDLTKNRTSGPGGQHRNKVESQVILFHTPTGLEVQAGERRSSHENKRVALHRLRLMLAVHHRGGVPAGDIGSPLWKARRRLPARPKITYEEIAPGVKVKLRDPTTAGAGAGTIACSPDHFDYPALLAEALDVIADAGWDVKAAAARLQVSMSQLLKLVKDHPAAIQHMNAERIKRGMHPLK